AADFNGDGKLDLAVTIQSSNSVTIFLGHGDGTFTASPLSPATGSYPNAIATGDFNGDGIADLAVVNGSSNTVTILLGNGDGTFTPTAHSPQTGSDPLSLVVGDFNGDGIQDVAVMNYYGNSVSILLGNGDGTFSTGAAQALGVYPSGIAAGDFNGDGIQDLAVTNYSYSTVIVLLGKGDGTFTRTTSSPGTGPNPQSVVVADLNGDGIQDLAVTNTYADTVTTLLGKGDGSFTAGPTAATGADPQAIAAGNFNGSGVPGLAVVNTSGNSVTILTGQLTQTAKATATGISPGGSGGHAVDASYAGDNSYKSSVSGTIQLTGQLATATLTVTPNTSSITTAGLLQVSVSLSGGGSNPTPTGNVTLTSGTYTSSPTALSGGTATIPVSAWQLALGSNTLTVSYAGDGNYKAVSGAAAVTVAATTPTVTVSPSLTSITAAQAVVVTVAVSSSGGPGMPPASGSVTLTSGSYTSAATALGGGGATITIPGGSLSIGSDSLNATYIPDAPGLLLYDGASGVATINVGATAPTITFSVANHTYGDAPFAVSAASNSTGAMSYSVVSGPASLSGSTLTISGAGAVVLQASQAAAGGYTAGTQTASFSIAPQSQTISFAPLSPVSYGGSPVPLSASSSSGLAVAFHVVSGPGSISGSTLTLLGPGTVVVAADQAGNTNYTAAAEVTASVTVNKGAPAAGLTASANPVMLQNSVTLTATFSSAVGMPTGSVVFSDGGTILGTATITGGIATLSVSTLAVGTHSITALYSGDGNFSAMSSGVLSETVQDFSFTTGGSLSQTVQPGGTATFILPMSPSGGTKFPAAVTFSVSGLPAGFTATFSPASLSAGSSATSVSMAIQAPLTAMLDDNTRPGRGLPMVALGLLMLPFLGRMNRAGKRLRYLIALVVLGGACVATLVTGCGTGNSSSVRQAQSYVVTVTAISGTLSHSINATLTVQ
ncbi:MAG TPA: FG-GAP-like repeat-containing protein, partial [Acidobacteriaceae bacterium]|nr:FG-GAP-like repeat-containing protein [Acidobacteriaceae bacterium]